MTKRNIATSVASPTKTVRVIEEHSYEKEVPIIEEAVAAKEEEPQVPDIFSTFNEIVSTNQSAILRIWRLPNYEIDGRASTYATDREYCGSVPYSADNAALLDQIQGRVPIGGMLQLELFADGAVRKRGLLKLIKAPQAINPTYGNGQQGTHLVINQPAAATVPQQQVSPAEVMREHMSLAKDLVAMARDLAPPAPTINLGEARQAEEKPMEERLFEAVLVKALESGKTPVDRVIDALSGRRSEPSTMETILEVVKAFAPTVDKVAQEFISMQRQARAQQAQNAAPAPTQLGNLPTEPVSAEPVIEGEQQQPSPPVDPVGRAWMRVLYRLLEDCTEHVALSQVSADRISVIPSAEAIADLADRFPEQLGPTIEQVLAATPDDVLTMCGMLLGEAGRAHIEVHLKPFPAAAAWIEELQTTCKNILSEPDESQEKEPGDENQTGDI